MTKGVDSNRVLDGKPRPSEYNIARCCIARADERTNQIRYVQYAHQDSTRMSVGKCLI